jgi:hypothetical protein
MKGAQWIVCAALASGCGAAMQEHTTATAAKAEAQDESHQEIAQLEGRIAYRRDQLGLAPAEAPSNAGAPPPVEEPPPARAEVDAKRSAASPQPAAPSPVMARPGAFAERAEVSEAAPPVRATRCKDVATAADEICDAASRICRIADQVADEPAHASCGRAREDCRHAKDLSSGCR